MSDKKLDKRARDDRSVRTVSVVVPCAHSHVVHLVEVVGALYAQTRKPDQIVVAVSGCEASELPKLNAEVVHSRDRQTAGANRNRGTAVSRGDVVIYQDADDLPHPQRVEIIAALFEKYEIDHLMHGYYRHTPRVEEFSVRDAARRSRYCKRSVGYDITNGNPAVARSVFDAVRWPEYAHVGEDVEFNAKVYAHTKRTVVTELPLMTYRQQLSSFKR